MYCLIELNTHIRAEKNKPKKGYKIIEEQSTFTPLREVHETMMAFRKCSFVVPEYNFLFHIFVCVVFLSFSNVFWLQASSVRLSVCLYLLMKTFHKEPIKIKNKLAWNLSSIQKKNANVYMM